MKKGQPRRFYTEEICKHCEERFFFHEDGRRYCGCEKLPTDPQNREELQLRAKEARRLGRLGLLPRRSMIPSLPPEDYTLELMAAERANWYD